MAGVVVFGGGMFCFYHMNIFSVFRVLCANISIHNFELNCRAYNFSKINKNKKPGKNYGLFRVLTVMWYTMFNTNGHYDHHHHHHHHYCLYVMNDPHRDDAITKN